MEKEFENYLRSQNLSEQTIKQYLLYNKKLDEILSKGIEMDQSVIYTFITYYKSNLVSSFVKQYLTFNNLNHLKVPKRKNKPRKKPLIMTKEDSASLLEYLKHNDYMIYLMIYLSYSCALRRQEALNVKVEDLNFYEWVKHYNNEEKRSGLLLIKKAKGDKERYVVVPYDVMYAIYYYCVAKNKPMNSFIFSKLTDHYKTITTKRYWERYNNAIKKLFGKKYKLHTLRSTKATEWYEAGEDIVSIQRRLGHSDISTTRSYINPDEKAELKRWQDQEDNPKNMNPSGN